MDISEKMRMCDIDKDILKPAIKELSKERNLFDQIRVPFKNLAYEKDKAKSRGRGGKVIGITFTFKPENVEIQKSFKTKNECEKYRGLMLLNDILKELKEQENLKFKRKDFYFLSQKEKILNTYNFSKKIIHKCLIH